MSKLRLGPIIEEKPVKVTIELSGKLHAEILDYAAAHARENGLEVPLQIEKLVPPIVERFIAGDRGFSKGRRRS